MHLSSGRLLRCLVLGSALLVTCLGRATETAEPRSEPEMTTNTAMKSENGTDFREMTTPQMTSTTVVEATTTNPSTELATDFAITEDAINATSLGPTSTENASQVNTTSSEMGLKINEILERGTETGTKATTTRPEDSRQEKRLFIEDPQDEGSPSAGSCQCDANDLANFDLSTCVGKRVIADPACPCRQKCAQQNGQGCSEMNPCDVEFGLACEKHSSTCQGKLQIQRSETTHNSMVLRWKPSRTEELPQATVMYTTNYTRASTRWMEAEPKESMVKIDGLQPNTEYFVRIEENGHYEMAVVKTKNGCVVNGTASFGEGETFNVGCQQTCTCDRNGKTECRQRCEFQPGSITDQSCVEIFDENDPCCVTYHCKDNPVPSTPKVLVTKRTPSSLTIAWDDFKLPNYESGYVVEYRAMREDKPLDWIPVQGGNIPLMTVTRLKPHTAYQVRVSVWDDMESRKLGTSSEMVTIYTEDGCVRNNQTYYVGMEFFEGCDLRCACKGDDEGNCKERCTPPLLRAGAEPMEPHCIEVPAGDDPCCVKIQCTQPKSEGLDLADITFSEKHGLCPGEVEAGDADDCPTNCHHDHQCAGSMKCCQSSCGGSLCVEPFTSRNACMHIVCGPNALCINTEDKPSCVCFPGFSGDPSDLHRGCVKDGATGRSVETCTYDNTSYNPGDIFFDGCKYRCECKNDLQVDCMDRCLFIVSKENLEDPLCKTVTDANDPCCKVLKCESSSNNMLGKFHGKYPDANKSNFLNSSPEEPLNAMEEIENNSTKPSFQTTTYPHDGYQKEIQSKPSEASKIESSFTDSYQTNTMDTKAPFEIKLNTGLNDMEQDTVERKSEGGTHFPMETTIVPNYHKRTELEKNMDDLNTVKNKSYKDTGLNETREREDIPTIENPIRFKGCEHNNHTYQLGEVFEDGCESQCICDGSGHLSCVPRCPPPGDYGPKCSIVPDPSDKCCYITMCNAPGDDDTISDPIGLGIRLESAKAQNASSIALRIKFVAPAVPTDNIQVWYAPFEDNISADKPVTWTKQKFSLGQLKLLEPHVVEAEIADLQPSTEYYVKVVKPDMDPIMPVLFSNTVSVKTFPSVVKTAFKGCFHHNKTYDAGDVFFDGCDYRCVCHENGLVECRERCDVYVDTIGLEHCQWVPAPDDPCCTVPYCKETNPRAPLRPFENPQMPTKKAFCVIGTGDVKPVGAKWEVSDGCQHQTCSCLLLPNETTTVDCKGGCPPLPSNIQHPTQDCPQPVLVNPDDPCLCPYIVCSNSLNPLSVPAPMCEHKGHRYHVGEEFYDGCRAVCHCGRDLRVNCASTECPQHFSPHLSECLEWEEDPNFVPNPPNCCPQPRCKSDWSCILNGHRFGNFQPIPQDLVDCSARCICIQGNITCENRCQPIGDVPPHNLPCSPQMAYQGHLPGDTCCLHWMCRQQENGGHELQHVNIISINSTTIRVRFTLPPMMVGLMGHAELHFTTDPSVPRAAWHVQKFARPKRLFDTHNIEYYMYGLRPDTTYFFQLFITVEALPKGPESEVFKLRMPPVPATITTTVTEIPTETSAITLASVSSTLTTTIKTTLPSSTSTTSSTTFLPMMILDPGLSVTDIRPSSARVSWRAFGLKEKRYIDGFRLKYKTANERDSQWITTPMIHRDVKSYVIRDLKPGTSYMMDLQFVTPEDIPTHLMSSNPIEMRTADPPKDEYNFHVTLKKAKVGPYGCEISLEGIPQPLSKYVHVVRTTYKTEADAEQSQTFKIPKNNNVVLENLKPGHRYKVWLDLYLTNGKTISADVIEFLTKAAPPESRTANVQTGNSAEALQITHDSAENEAYYVALIVVAIVAAVAGVGFTVVLVILMRKQTSAKAPITRSPSESAYDNPTYKTYDGERSDDKNGSIQP